jgi:hypothetical protein
MQSTTTPSPTPIPKVTQIFGDRANQRVTERERFTPDFEHAVNLPLCEADAPDLLKYLEERGLDRDARGLWVGYSNLQQAVTRLQQWIGPHWPSQEDENDPAVFRAVVRGINSVKEGLLRGESDRRYVIANFHSGLAKIAADLTGFTAWGCSGSKASNQFQPFDIKFSDWADAGKFDKVIFSPRSAVASDEICGTIWKMRAFIAPVRDIGVVHKYSER